MDFPLLQDIVILLGFSVLVVFILQRFRLPSILGFLMTGFIIGPYGFSLIENHEQVEVLSEIGVILLLFVIGMELTVSQLASIKRTVLYGGFVQVGLSIAVTTGVFLLLGLPWNVSVFIGFLISLSSTAIVLKILQDRNEISAPHGRTALGLLIFQDIIVVPMMLFTPLLAGSSSNVGEEILMLLVKSGLIILLTYVAARYLVPKALYLIAKTRSKELFLLSTITLCFTVAFLTASAGLSLAFGAFLAGLIISESEYSYQATSMILPFRELFISFFFISIGMLLDMDFFLRHFGLILLLVLAVFVVKGSIIAIATAVLKYPLRTILLTGLALFQIGEFSFILSRIGLEQGLLTPEMNQYFLSVSVISMLFTPFIIIFSERISSFFLSSGIRKPLQLLTAKPKYSDHSLLKDLENHLIIIGYGINGNNLAKAAKYAGIPYVILELNAEMVKTERAKGEPIYYGDAVHEHILDRVKVKKARVVVVAISDPQATKIIVANIRHLSSSVFLLVRTRYVKEIETLLALGADEVIPEEFETSVEIFSRVLSNYLVPVDELESLVDSIRADNYEVLQSKKRHPKTLTSSRIPDFKITCVRIMADRGEVTGKTIEEADIRKKFGVNVLAIERKDTMINRVTPDLKLLKNDRVFISGDQEHIESFFKAVN
ncbi:monovalent cation:proton antiporter-2 (CPA2) family protein [Salinimicrobium flavum]|uniref:Monovalent cation:proton antiporter-2 (CPA2) family protein n=1 Tax=Salinimicrobium flavum TaxID=1737065 RepID=A0ABW5J0V6_9FLAO